MEHIAHLRNLAKTNGTLQYHNRADEFVLAPRSGLGGRLIRWLRSVFTRRKINQPPPHGKEPSGHSDTMQKFAAAMDIHYGNEIMQNLVSSRHGQQFDKAGCLKTRMARQLISQADHDSLAIMVPLVDELKRNPDKLENFWRNMSAHNLLNSGVAMEFMQIQAFPPNSPAEYLRKLMAAGFFMIFREPPQLKHIAGEYALDYQSTVFNPKDVTAIDSMFANGDEVLLSPNQVYPHINAHGELDVEAFFAALPETSQLRKDIARDMAAVAFTIAGKTDFKTPQALLRSLWESADKNPEKFRRLCDMVTQTPGNYLSARLFASKAPEFVDLAIEGKQTAQQRVVTIDSVKGKLIGQVSIQEVAGKGYKVCTIDGTGHGSNQHFTFGDGTKLHRQHYLQFAINNTGDLKTHKVKADFSFAGPLKSIGWDDAA